MAKLSNLKRIIKEDFPEEYQELIDKLAYALNPYLEQVSSAFNKNITIENLSREYISITVENSGGKPKIPIQFKTGLSGRLVGMSVIRADNVTNPAAYPSQTPFISWTVNERIVTIKNITGIQDNNKYTLTLEVIS